MTYTICSRLCKFVATIDGDNMNVVSSSLFSLPLLMHLLCNYVLPLRRYYYERANRCKIIWIISMLNWSNVRYHIRNSKISTANYISWICLVYDTLFVYRTFYQTLILLVAWIYTILNLVRIFLKISITFLISNDSDSIIFYVNHDTDSAGLEFQLFLPIQSNADCTPTFASLIHGIICIRKKEKLGRCYVQVDTKPNEEDVF